LTQLTRLAKQADFGVFLFAADDITRTKGKEVRSVRDNVLFEAGLFTGALGIRRCFIIVPKGEEVHIPSDLAGLTLLTFKSSQKNTAAALGPACNEIKKAIRRLGFHKKELLKNFSRTVKKAPLSKKRMTIPKKIRKLPVSFK
jgi:predicted nucleotide-binding protein